MPKKDVSCPGYSSWAPRLGAKVRGNTAAANCSPVLLNKYLTCPSPIHGFIQLNTLLPNKKGLMNHHFLTETHCQKNSSPSPKALHTLGDATIQLEVSGVEILSLFYIHDLYHPPSP